MTKSRQTVLTVLLIVVAVGLIWAHEAQPLPKPEFLKTSLDQLEAKSLDAVVEMNKLMISLSLLVIAGVSGLLLGKYSEVKVQGYLPTFALLLCLIAAASSIFSGYVLYDNLIVMLSNQFYNPSNSLIKWPQRLQFYSFFFSIILFGSFIVTITLGGRRAIAEPQSDASTTVKQK
jgi:hypothetical protein